VLPVIFPYKKNAGDVVGTKEERKLAFSWFVNTLRKRLFSPVVNGEINWLLNHLSENITEKSFFVSVILKKVLITIQMQNNSSNIY
jgi:hypothetical protein